MIEYNTLPEKIILYSIRWGFAKIGGPRQRDPQIVRFPYHQDPKKVPLVSESLNPKP